jgi:GntR family transcriptional regulator, transcriptional repressor for pyruvate dehydrogenase complex
MATEIADAVRAVGEAVRVPKTAELIAAQLRRQIVAGELAEGVSLPSEAELMGQFRVSRPTLREGFRILEAESLIVIRRGSRGGARVMAPHPGVAARYAGLLLQAERVSIGDVYEARSIIEPAAARMLADRRTAADLGDLDACIGKLRDVLDGQPGTGRPDLSAWSAGTERFHDLIVDRAGNRTLAVQAGMLREVIRAHLAAAIPRMFDPVRAPEGLDATIRSYAKLVRLIEASDPDAAEKHWRRHLEAAAAELLRGEGARATVDLFP